MDKHKTFYYTRNGEKKDVYIQRLSMFEEREVSLLRRELLEKRKASDEKPGSEDYEVCRKEAYILTFCINEDNTPHFPSVEEFQKNITAAAMNILYAEYKIFETMQTGVLSSFDEDSFAEITTDMNSGDENVISPFYSRLDVGQRYLYTRILASRYATLLAEKYSGGGLPFDGVSSTIQAG